MNELSGSYRFYYNPQTTIFDFLSRLFVVVRKIKLQSIWRNSLISIGTHDPSTTDRFFQVEQRLLILVMRCAWAIDTVSTSSYSRYCASQSFSQSRFKDFDVMAGLGTMPPGFSGKSCR
jgi:hypothetical protein